jgi:hypothetical protein
VPSVPVKPCTMILESLFTKIAMRFDLNSVYWWTKIGEKLDVHMGPV